MTGNLQHTVQKRLLANFTLNPNESYKKQQIWVYDKNREKSYCKNISKVAVIKNFLKKDADDYITILEKELSPVIDTIIETKLIYDRTMSPIDREKNLRYLYRYIVMQLCRTPKFRNKIRNSLGNLFNLTDEEYLKNLQSQFFSKLKENGHFLDFGFGRADPNSKYQYANQYYNWIQKLSSVPFLGFDAIAAALIDISLPVVVVNKTSTPYLQNDIGLCPFFPVGDTRLNLKYKTRDGPKLDILCVFPIDPVTIICICTLKSYNEWGKSFNFNKNRGALLYSNLVEDVTRTNFYLLEFAEEYIYCNQEFQTEYVEIK